MFSLITGLKREYPQEDDEAPQPKRKKEGIPQGKEKEKNKEMDKEKEKEKGKEKGKEKEKDKEDRTTLTDSEEDDYEEEFKSKDVVYFHTSHKQLNTISQTAFDSLHPEQRRAVQDLFQRHFPFRAFPTARAIRAETEELAEFRASAWRLMELWGVYWAVSKWSKNQIKNRERDAKTHLKAGSPGSVGSATPAQPLPPSTPTGSFGGSTMASPLINRTPAGSGGSSATASPSSMTSPSSYSFLLLAMLTTSISMLLFSQGP